MKTLVRTLMNYLGQLSLRFILLSLLFLLGLAAQINLTEDVFHDGDTGFDTRLFALASQTTSPGMTRAMRWITFLGSEEYLLVVPVVLALVLTFYKKMQGYGLKVLVICLTTALLNQLLKFLHQRPRPLLGFQEASGMSFPSGHAMIGGVFYGLLIYIILSTVKSKAWRWVLTLLFTALILLVGWSRIYLRMHYATDVIAGYLIGALWLLISLYLLGKIETRSRSRLHRRKKRPAAGDPPA